MKRQNISKIKNLKNSARTDKTYDKKHLDVLNSFDSQYLSGSRQFLPNSAKILLQLQKQAILEKKTQEANVNKSQKIIATNMASLVKQENKKLYIHDVMTFGEKKTTVKFFPKLHENSTNIDNISNIKKLALNISSTKCIFHQGDSYESVEDIDISEMKILGDND